MVAVEVELLEAKLEGGQVGRGKPASPAPLRWTSFEEFFQEYFGFEPTYWAPRDPLYKPFHAALRFSLLVPVFPTKPGKKNPACPNGLYDATRDFKRIKEFFPREEEHNIAVPMFPIAEDDDYIEFLCAVDVDLKTKADAESREIEIRVNGLATLLELKAQGISFEPKALVRTRNGGIQFLRRIRLHRDELPGLRELHLQDIIRRDESGRGCFEAPGIKRIPELFPGIDFRIGPHYSLIYGQVSADPGSLGDGIYRWVGELPHDIPLLEAPIRERVISSWKREDSEESRGKPDEGAQALKKRAEGAPARKQERTRAAGHIKITHDSIDPLIRLIWDRLPWWAFTGDGFKFRCTGHEDKNPSANIDLGADGSLLIHDHKEPDPCSAEQILKAINPGLEVRHLFPKHRYEIAQRFGRKYDLVYLILEKFLKENPNGFRGTAEALHRLLTPMVPEYLRDTKAWPKNGQALSKRINLIAKKGVAFKGYKLVHQRSNGIRKLFIIPEDSREVRRVSEDVVARIKEGILRRKSEVETSQCRIDVLNVSRGFSNLSPDSNLGLLPSGYKLKSRLIELNLGLVSSNPQGLYLIPRLNLSPNRGIDTSPGANLDPTTSSPGDNISPCRDAHGFEFPDGIDSRDSITPAQSNSELEFDDSQFARIEFGDRDQLESESEDCLMDNADFVRRGFTANSDGKNSTAENQKPAMIADEDETFTGDWVSDDERAHALYADENDDIPAAFGAYFPPALVADRINPGTYPSPKDASRKIRMPQKDTLTAEQEKIIRAVEMDSMFRDELVNWRSPLKPWNLENPTKYPEAYAPVVEFIRDLIMKYAPNASGYFLEELIRAGISGFALALNDEEKEFCAKEIEDLFLRDLCPL